MLLLYDRLYVWNAVIISSVYTASDIAILRRLAGFNGLLQRTFVHLQLFPRPFQLPSSRSDVRV